MTPARYRLEAYNAPLRAWWTLPYDFPSPAAALALLGHLRAAEPDRELRLAPQPPHVAA